MKIILALFLASGLAAQCATNLVLRHWTFTNLQGRIFSNTTLVAATLTSISVDWDSDGYARIDFTNLPPDVREMFHYDPDKVAALKATAEAARNAEAESAAQIGRSIAIANAAHSQLSTEFDPIRQTVAWQPKEPLRPVAPDAQNMSFFVSVTTQDGALTKTVWRDYFTLSFAAVLPQSLVKISTNGQQVSFKPLATPSAVTLHLHSHSRDWIFLKRHDFIILYDANREDVGDLEHHGDVGMALDDAAVTEDFFPNLTYEEFSSVARAKSVKAVLGPVQFEISNPDREAMRALVNYFDDQERQRNRPKPATAGDK